MVKSTGCSFEGLRFNSHNPHGWLTTFTSDLSRHFTHTGSTHMQTKPHTRINKHMFKYANTTESNIQILYNFIQNPVILQK